MTDKELLQQALDSLEWAERRYSHANLDLFNKPIEAIRTRLEQPEPEPVAKVFLTEKLSLPCLQWLDLTRQFDFKGGELLYTAPPKKEWVGLTDEDAVNTLDEVLSCVDVEFLKRAARAIEAKLKEKNND